MSASAIFILDLKGKVSLWRLVVEGEVDIRLTNEAPATRKEYVSCQKVQSQNERTLLVHCGGCSLQNMPEYLDFLSVHDSVCPVIM